MKRLAALVALSFCAGCVALNPYARAGKHMLHRDGLTFCWAPLQAPEKETSCSAERFASANLTECVQSLRSNVTLFTTEQVADGKLVACMRSKGWQRIWIGGVMLFGLQPNYSLKRTAGISAAVRSQRSWPAATLAQALGQLERCLCSSAHTALLLLVRSPP